MLTRKRLTGIVLAIVGLSMLSTFSEIVTVSSMLSGLLGIVLFVAGILLVLDYLGTPSIVVRARQGTTQPLGTKAAPDIVERTFRSAFGSGTLMVLYALGAFFALMGLFFIYVAFDKGIEKADELILLLIYVCMFCGTAAFMFWYGYRATKLSVTVDRQGITHRGYIRAVHIPWSEVVALASQGSIMAGPRYFVISPSSYIAFYLRHIEGGAELVDLLAKVFGLQPVALPK